MVKSNGHPTNCLVTSLTYLPITFQHPKTHQYQWRNTTKINNKQQKISKNSHFPVFRGFSLTLLWILVPFNGPTGRGDPWAPVPPVPPVPVTPPPRAVRWSRWRARRAVNSSTHGAPDFRQIFGWFLWGFHGIFTHHLASLSCFLGGSSHQRRIPWGMFFGRDYPRCPRRPWGTVPGDFSAEKNVGTQCGTQNQRLVLRVIKNQRLCWKTQIAPHLRPSS